MLSARYGKSTYGGPDQLGLLSGIGERANQRRKNFATPVREQIKEPQVQAVAVCNVSSDLPLVRSAVLQLSNHLDKTGSA